MVGVMETSAVAGDRWMATGIFEYRWEIIKSRCEMETESRKKP